MFPLALPPDAAADLNALADSLSLRDRDLVLLGDGSGTVFSTPGAWCCATLDRRGGNGVLHAGAVTGATNNFAELAPYVQALWYYEQGRDPVTRPPVRVGIVSDSELTVKCGRGEYARRANGCLWASIAWFEENGYALTWRHVRRSSNAWNRLADHVAGLTRKALLAGLSGAVFPGRDAALRV